MSKKTIDVAARDSKFNVSKSTDGRTYNGIVFDSAIEMRYYRDVVLPLAEDGIIKKYELQKPYELQPKFKHDGKTIRSIMYVADFYIEYKDGHIEVIDTKGCPDSSALLKRKLFWYRYPDINYRWLVYYKKYGGWIDYDECKKLRREQKKMKEAQKKETA